MTPSGPECACPESCSQDSGQMFEGLICGTDNKMYASKCQLEMSACRHQMDIKVLSYGPCLGWLLGGLEKVVLCSYGLKDN